MLVDITYFLLLNLLIFIFGFLGILYNKQSILLILLSIELLLLSVNLNFILFSIYLDDFFGQFCTFFIFTVAAGESAVGLSVIISYYKVKKTMLMHEINLMHG